MRQMKDSLIPWIGKVPEDWNLIRNKRVMKRIKDIHPHYLGETVLSLSMNGVIARDLDNPYGKMPESFDGYQYVNKDNLLMCLFDIDVTPRCVGVIECDGVTSPAYSQFELLNDNDADYYYYYYLYLDHRKELLHLAKNLRHSFTEAQLGELIVPVPPVVEQVKIADYLDSKCSQIDSIIEKQEAIIEKLKEYKLSVITEAVTKGLDPNVEMKDSGIEWIGNIPSHWNSIKLKYCSYIRARLGWKGLKAEEYVESGYPLLSAFNIVDDRVDFDHNINYINQIRYDESPEIKLENGDILLVKDGAGIGKCGIIDELPCPATTNGSLAVVTTDKRIYSKYLYFYFLSSIFQHYIDRIKDGMGVPHLFQSDLKEIQIVYPSFEEQIEIVKALEDKMVIIESYIKSIGSIKERLQEYRKSLIYEVVTGKKEV